MSGKCYQPGKDTDWLTMAKEVLDIEVEGIREVRAGLDQEFLQALQLIAECSGRVVITGLGKSGLVGRKIAATLSSTGTPSFFLHPVEGAHGDMGMIRPEDIVLAISNSGETDELNSLIPSLRALGVKIISITGNPHSSLAESSDLHICCKVPKEACPLGLAPTASTTAVLALGDAIAVCLINWNSFDETSFQRFHPGGFLGRRLTRSIVEFMHTDSLPLVNEGDSLQTALEALNQGGLGTVAVAGKGNILQGILTDGDVRRVVCRGGMDLSGPVDDYMTRNPKRCTPSQSAGEVLDLMEEKEITVLPIVDETDRILGMVHLHDLLGKGRFKFGAERDNSLPG